MNKQDTRRRNSIAHITLILVVLVLGFEALIIFGVFELKSKTVAKYAPWAYESFLRLAGEHPESTPHWATVEEAEENVESSILGVTGLEPSAIPVLVETNETVLATNLILEATVPVELNPDSVPVATPIPGPLADEEEVVPVG